jgi:hypothetical protein
VSTFLWRLITPSGVLKIKGKRILGDIFYFSWP